MADNATIITGFVARITRLLATGQDFETVANVLRGEGLSPRQAQFLISVAHTAANVILDGEDGINQPEALAEFKKLGLQDGAIDHILVAARTAIEDLETTADTPESNYTYWRESYRSLLSRTSITDDAILSPYFILFRGVMAMRGKGMSDKDMVEKMAAHVPMNEQERLGFVENCTVIEEALALIRKGQATSVINSIATRRFSPAISIMICGLAKDHFGELTGNRPVLA